MLLVYAISSDLPLGGTVMNIAETDNSRYEEVVDVEAHFRW